MGKERNMIVLKKNTIHNLVLWAFCFFAFATVVFNSSGYNKICNLLYIPFALGAVINIVKREKIVIGEEDSWFVIFGIARIISAALFGKEISLFETCYSSISLCTILIFMNQTFVREDIKSISNAVIAGALVLGLWSFIVRSDVAGARLGSETANSINLGIALAFGSIFLIYRVMQDGLKRDFILYIFSIIMIFLTKCRSALLLSGAVTVFLYFFSGNRKKGRRKISKRKIGVIIFLVLLLGIGIFSGFFKTYLYRFTVIFSELNGNRMASNSVAVRMRFKELGWSMICLKPGIGYGVGSAKVLLDGGYFHDNYVELAYEMGIVGLILFYIPYIMCLVKSIKVKDMLSIAILIFIIGMGCFDVFIHNKLFYIMFGSCIIERKRN